MAEDLPWQKLDSGLMQSSSPASIRSASGNYHAALASNKRKGNPPSGSKWQNLPTSNACDREVIVKIEERRKNMITKCESCNRFERVLLESIIDADKADTALRCYLITHQWSASVSDMDEYNALRAEQQRMTERRHEAYTALISHAMNHGDSVSRGANSVL
jgi:hypothetical protein